MKRLTDNILTGKDPHLGLLFYYSPHFKQNIVRRISSLTGERTRKDPAFTGFRRSSSRLKTASPIAAALYKLLPAPVKEYARYRILTGKVILLLKEGMEPALITETLKKEYIDPLLNAPVKSPEKRKEQKEKEQVNGMTDFNANPPITAGIRSIKRIRRSCLLRKTRAILPENGNTPQKDSKPLPPAGSDIPTPDRTKPLPQARNYMSPPDRTEPLPSAGSNRSPLNKTETPEPVGKSPRIKTTADLIYLCRLQECKTIKIWLPPVIPHPPISKTELRKLRILPSGTNTL